MSKPKITFRACLFDMSGYATISRNILLELYKTGQFDLAVEPLRWINSGNIPLDPEDERILRQLEDKHMTEEYQQNKSQYSIVHFSIATEYQDRYEQKKAFGYTMLETDKIPYLWVQKCNKMDGVFVPSHFNLGSFMKSGVTKPIRTVPLGIDFNLFGLDKEPLYPKGALPTNFNFLVVGQWTPQDRKNIGQTIKVFLETFKGQDDVGLIAKVHGFSAGTYDKINCVERIQEIRRMVGLRPNEGPYIYLIHGAMSSEQVSRLYHNADVFILPTLGEAWGMPILEAVVSGLPVITTGGTGAETYLNPHYSILLNHKWNKIPQRMYWQYVYEPYQEITVPDWAEFVRMLRRTKDMYSLTKENALKQREEIIERDFSWKKCAENLILAMKDLGGI